MADSTTDSDDFYYQLKRIGPPPSCARVPSVMRLNLGLTKIGRGQSNNYFLDSSLLKNFISRSHAEIFGSRLECGDVEFVLTDKGLNGTFINDIRTQKTVTLQEGDKITFGHTNGYKIQPGSTATQPNSEFQFLYEKIPKTPRTSEISDIGLSQDNFNREETKDIHQEHTVDSAGDRSPTHRSPTRHQNIQKSPHKKSKLLDDTQTISTNDISAQMDTSNSKSISGSKKHHKSRKRNSDSTGSSSAMEGNTSKGRVSRSSRSLCSETLPAVDDSDEDLEEEEEEEAELSDTREKPKVSRRRAQPKKTRKSKKSHPVKEEIMSFSEESSDNADDAEEEEEDDDDDDDYKKPEADQKRSRKTLSSNLPVVPAKPKQKPARKFPKKRALKEEEPAPSTTKGASKSSGKKSAKKRKVTATTTSQTSEAKDEPVPVGLEAGVEWYEGDKCASEGCKQPKKKRTQWIQCDDCDNWYHTVCVGLSNKQVEALDDYHCGCV